MNFALIMLILLLITGGVWLLDALVLQTAYEIRQQAYWSQLAGGYHVYGHNESWQKPREWQTWIDAPGAQNLAVFRQVITSLPEWWLAVPDPSLFTGQAGMPGRMNPALRAANGDWVLAYISQPGRFGLHLPFSGSFRVTWIDPHSAGRTILKWGKAEREISTPHGWSDALLLLER